MSQNCDDSQSTRKVHKINSREGPYQLTIIRYSVDMISLVVSSHSKTNYIINSFLKTIKKLATSQ